MQMAFFNKSNKIKRADQISATVILSTFDSNIFYQSSIVMTL